MNLQFLSFTISTGTCLEVWKIFIRTADVSSLGPIISTIFISLEPFLESYPVEVNEIYKYLVIDNKNLLSLHILDLFFVDSILVDNSIKSTIKSQMERQRNEETFLEKCHRYIERINHEDSKVRTYALQYFKKLLEGNRTELNHMIVGQIFINPLIEKMLEVLIKNCKSDNRELQLIASRCLGEIGAVEPGLLAPNYAPQYPISAYSADSDEFAILALKELCRSFHQQSNYKHTDSFSLAIQEILKARKVNPELNQNMEVWNVVPERMRPFVQPLLTSNYTSIAMDSSRVSEDFLPEKYLKLHDFTLVSVPESSTVWHKFIESQRMGLLVGVQALGKSIQSSNKRFAERHQA